MELLGLGSEGRMINAALVNAGAASASAIRSVHRFTAFSLQLIISSLTGAFTGTWLIEASNNWAPDPGELGQPANAGNWTDVTSLFTPAPAAVTANSTQIVEPTRVPNGWRALRITLTRTGGTSAIADVWICGKGH